MKTSDFFFELPQDLIAQYPAEKRGESRLMILDQKSKICAHEKIFNLPDILSGENFQSTSGEKPLLVFNDTKVRKARIEGISQTGKYAEFLLIDKKDENNKVWKALVKKARNKKNGQYFTILDKNKNEVNKAVVLGHEGEYLLMEFEKTINDERLDKYGHIPLPLYIKRKDVPADEKRYQTIYAKETGSAAAPTAGLHFTDEIFNRLKERGMEIVFITLHVGLGTFLPVRSEHIEDHVMHEETFFIDGQTAEKIEKAKSTGRRIVAVGTTSARSLESAWSNGKIATGRNKTSIFIYPGFKFNVIDALFTNFHTPESSLLMLVCAFAGKDFIMESYAQAIRERYRFFSYGDAMLIHS
ncbi:MAG: tRNA preQ1(34) S-adenosylmethionine ribosyltransferase-isomerase QueA [Treponema sp.]|nr:tRNA preQ1(34) S-adenosylmethionine ribosyltransferase-isomerase QueA [Treponema sp.]